MNEYLKVIMGNGWILIRNIVCVVGIILLYVGAQMTIQGVAGGGSINVKTAIFEGELKSGTIGLLFAFMGFILLSFCILKKGKIITDYKREADGAFHITAKGGLSKETANNLQVLISATMPCLNNTSKDENEEETSCEEK